MFNFKSFLQKRLRNEFEAEFENHLIGNQKIYRLHYILYYRAEGKTDGFRIMNCTFDPFELPDGISREDAFKILSYLTDYIERTSGLAPCSYKSVNTLNEVLNLQRLGFKKLDEKCDEKDILDLWTVDGRVLLFKEGPYYPSYFEWYYENITLTEVQNIYKKIGIEFYDLNLQ